MLTKQFYEDIQSIIELPEERYREGERPAFLLETHERFLLNRGYLERQTIIPAEKEDAYPNGLFDICVSPFGHYALSLYDEQLLKERRELRQFYMTIALAVLALPGILDGLLAFIRNFQ